MWLVQKLSLVSTTIRANLTCALFFQSTAKEAKFIEDEYRPSGVDRELFRQVFEECVQEPYSFMMLDFRKPVGEMFWKRFEFPIKFY